MNDKFEFFKIYFSLTQVTPGTVARITTGSALPDGADAVVMVEDTLLLPTGKYYSLLSIIHRCTGEDKVEKVKIEAVVRQGADIRPIGCDIPVGQVSPLFAYSFLLTSYVTIGNTEIRRSPWASRNRLTCYSWNFGS